VTESLLEVRVRRPAAGAAAPELEEAFARHALRPWLRAAFGGWVALGLRLG
jgi:hypothetical protein